MIQINNAILHIFDYSHDHLVFSEDVLSNDDRSQLHFASKQIDRLLHSPTIKEGDFLPHSVFFNQIEQYIKDELSLLDLSRDLARQWYDLIKETDKIDDATLLVCDVHDNANHYLVALKYKNKNGYQYQAKKQDGKVIHHVIENESILPNGSQSIDECFLILLDTGHVYVKDIKRTYKGEEIYLLPDRILTCSQQLSVKDVLKTIQQLGESFSETYELDSIQTQSRTKEYLQQQLQDDGYLYRDQLASFVFPQNAVMAQEFMQESSQLQVPDMLRLHEKFVGNQTKRQRLKMDNGIELLLPASFYDDPNQFEMIKNDDDSFNIVLKNIRSMK